MLRATLKSLLSRKLRLMLSAFAVVLSVMFVAGSFVLTDTLSRTFDNLYTNVYTYVDLEASIKPRAGFGDTMAPPRIHPSEVQTVAKVPGVAKASGEISSQELKVYDRRGRQVTNSSNAYLGGNWSESELVKLVDGHAPGNDDEIVVNRRMAKSAKLAPGDTVTLTCRDVRRTFTVGGVFVYAGGRDSLGGEFYMAFTERTAQQYLLGGPDLYSTINVKLASGADLQQTRSAVQRALGDEYQVQNGTELADKQTKPLKTIFKYIRNVLFGFGGVALLVGIFLILNTFSIIVAQRTRELALMRAIGASRGQVLRSVLIEALLIGVIGSAAGFGVGVGIGAVGALVIGSSMNGVELASVGVPAAAVVLSFLVGITVTVVAAVVPAVRASRIAPVEAMRSSGISDRPLTWITLGGAVVSAIGGGAMGWGLSGAGDATLPLVFGGVLALLVGVALLTPILSRPLTAAIGAMLSWSMPGSLGRRNAMRNPRRTAITASAVMIGIALIAAIATIFSSLKAGINTEVDKDIKADLIVSGPPMASTPTTMDAQVIAKIRALPGVSQAIGYAYEFGVVKETPVAVSTMDDLPQGWNLMSVEKSGGTIDTIKPGQVVLDDTTASKGNLRLGDQVKIAFPKDQLDQTFTVSGIYRHTVLVTGYFIGQQDATTMFRTAKPSSAYVQLRSGGDAAATRTQIEALLAENPDITVQTRAEYMDSTQNVIFDFILTIVQVLLLVAMAISVLGIVNTLVLSVTERTRELGMLRAIGLRRGQTMWMITVESIVISIFGTVLGLAVGVGLGSAIVYALKKEIEFGKLTLPWGSLVAYLFGSLVVGALAAVLPGARAARLNVLGAIAHE